MTDTTTQALEPELPELPNERYLGGDEDFGDVIFGYSADDVRAYALAAIEADRNKRALSPAADTVSDEEIRQDYNSAGDILAEITGCYDQGVMLWELADRAREMYGQLNHQNTKLQQSVAYAEGQAAEYRARYDAAMTGLRRVMAELAEAQREG